MKAQCFVDGSVLDHRHELAPKWLSVTASFGRWLKFLALARQASRKYLGEDDMTLNGFHPLKFLDIRPTVLLSEAFGLCRVRVLLRTDFSPRRRLTSR
jgi:hypothetical protein